MKKSWKYHKIMSVYKRNKDGSFVVGEYSTPEIEYLANNKWVFTEKVDGTNIRVKYNGKEVVYAGRSDDAQLPVKLIYKLDELFKHSEARERLAKVFPGATEEMPVFLYGEGYGAGIQKGGGNYNSNGVDFVLFDVIINDIDEQNGEIVAWQMERKNVDDIAENLSLRSVPVIGTGTLCDAIKMTKKGFKSQWGDFTAEGIVARPEVEMLSRKGERIVTKIKYRDFK